jgi:hypothetical protein
MTVVDRPAAGVDGAAEADAFGALDRAVGAGSADALEVGRIEEQRQIALVRRAMIDRRRRRRALMGALAQRFAV